MMIIYAGAGTASPHVVLVLRPVRRGRWHYLTRACKPQSAGLTVTAGRGPPVTLTVTGGPRRRRGTATVIVTVTAALRLAGPAPLPGRRQARAGGPRATVAA